MYSAYDHDHNFYYFGEVEPNPHLYRDYILQHKGTPIALDTETISLKEKIALGIGIAIEPKICFYFPLFPNPSSVTPWFLINNPDIERVYHNALFDLVVLREYDINLENIKDTAVMARLLNYPSAVLSDISPTVNMYTQEAKEFLLEHHCTTMLEAPKDKVAYKCCQDAGATLALYYDMLPKSDIKYLDIELATLPIMIKMSYQGLKIDQEVRQILELKYSGELDYYRSLCDGLGFSPGSPQQVSYILAKRGAYSVFSRLPHTRGANGRHTKNLSTDVDTLRKMTDPLARIVLDYRAKQKLLGTYIIPYAREDRAYCLAPETKVLRSDLSWVRIDTLECGDELVGVSKHHNGKWCMVGSKVTNTNPIKDISYKVTTNKGTVICNGAHKWLCTGWGNYYYDMGGEWVRTDKLRPTHRIKYFGDTWSGYESYDSGYLAGIFDGEGWVSRAEVGMSQKDGDVFDKVLYLLESLGLDHHKIHKDKYNINNVRLYGYNALRLLGSIRPTRLIDKARQVWDGRYLTRQESVTVESVELLGEYNLVGIQTSTETFIAEGMITHNTRFHLDAATGRPSSTDRNMQNIPGIKQQLLDGTNPRNMFIPDLECWTDMDFSQTELRTLAYMSGDLEMQHIYSLPEKLPDGSKNEEADIHQATANFLGIPRKIAKNVNFAFIYGATDETIANTAEIPNLNRCHQLKEGWMQKFPQAADWIQCCQEECITHPYATTVFGRKLRLPDIEEEGLEAVQRKSVNYRIQGTAAEILKRALIICQKHTMALQVHDEILFDSHVDVPKEQLEHIAPFSTPVEVRYLERWE
jgi:DNA polymerase I-like protein with 3'-5' exonuclease and polymerase domains